MAINKKTYLSKCNTIVKDSKVNTGLNPIMELNYGNIITRMLIYFDHNEVKKLVDDKTYPNIDKLKHILKITNASSVKSDIISYKNYDDLKHSCKERATSFDLVFFLIPKEWDNGRGFDFYKDYMPNSERAYNENACNWFQASNMEKWDYEGIYSSEILEKEIELYYSENGNASNIIIGIEHFDYGNENISCDITNTVNKFIKGEIKNNGIGIAFIPSLESEEKYLTQYVGFFSNKTNSFFEPYIETTYDDYIHDDRANFYLDKPNRLYFYSFLGGNLTNLDELPYCDVNGSKMASKQATKGIYYIDVTISSDEIDEDTMLYDTWSNLIHNGRKINDVELYFTTVSPNKFYTFGLPSDGIEKEEIIPVVYGIDNDEKIKRGDIRKINVECKIPYTSNQLYSIDNLCYRLYTMSGNDEIDVISWSNVEMAFNNNYFIIDTNDLLPSTYFIDIKYSNNEETINHYKLIKFNIVNEI